MSRSSSQIKNLLDAWEIFLRFRWRFVVPAFLVAAAVLGMSLMLPRKYEAEAIFERRTDTVLTDIMNRNATASFEHARQSLTQEVTGAPALDSLVAQLKPWVADRVRRGGPRVDLDALRNELDHAVLVRYDIASPTLDRVHISYIGSDSELARQVVNALVENYITSTRTEFEERLKESTSFFEVEVARSRKSIEALENRQLTYEIQHGDLLPDSPNGVESSLSDIQNRQSDARQKLDAANLKLAALQKALADMPRDTPSLTTERNPDLKVLQDKFRELEATEANDVNTLKMTPKHPELVSLRQDIAQLKARIAHTDADVVTQKNLTANPEYAQLGVMISQAKADQQAAQRQFDALQSRAEVLSGQTQQLFPIRAEYRKITRDVEQNQRQLAFWEDNLRRVKMATTAENGNRGVCLDFIKPCDPLRLPVSPDLAQVLMAALVLGLAAGAVSVVAAHRGDESFRDGDHLAESFGLPLFGSVSEIISRRQHRLRAARNMVLYPVNAGAMALILAVLTGLVYVSLRDPARFRQAVAPPRPALKITLPAPPTAADLGPQD